MVLKKYKEVNLAAKNKIQKIPVNKISNGKIDYFIENHKRQNKAKCFFCRDTIKFNPDFETRSTLICKIGDKMNLNQKSGFVNDHILDGYKPFAYYYYESEWIHEKQSFEIYVDFIFSDQKSDLIK